MARSFRRWRIFYVPPSRRSRDMHWGEGWSSRWPATCALPRRPRRWVCRRRRSESTPPLAALGGCRDWLESVAPRIWCSRGASSNRPKHSHWGSSNASASQARRWPRRWSSLRRLPRMRRWRCKWRSCRSIWSRAAEIPPRWSARVGAGTVGHGIAQGAAQAGYQAFLYDVSRDRAEKGVRKISENLKLGVDKGKVSPEERDAALARITPVDDLEAVSRCDLLIEAIPEDLSLKRSLFKKLSELCAPTAILASNTSSLSLTDIASAARGPERVVGMHFFNPVHLMKLLEIVRAYQTSDGTVQAVRGVGTRMGKQMIEVRDRPGFASTRLGVALGLQAVRMLEEGVATAEDIDRAMELGYGHPMGPLKLADLVGLDVRLAIAEYLYKELGSDAFRPPQLLKQMVRAGKLGRKTGEGFYKYLASGS